MKEVDLAQQYLNLCGKGILDIIKLIRTLCEQNNEAFEDKVQKRLLDTLKFYEKFIEEGQKGNEVFYIHNLSKKDKEAIEYYHNEILGDRLKDNVGDFSMPALFIPEADNGDMLKYGMILRQKDVNKLWKMCEYFKDNGIETDNLSLKDISIINDPNSLFSSIDIKKGEIEIPLVYENIFHNLVNFMCQNDYEFSIAAHDNSMSIIYRHEDQQKLLNQIYDDKNNQFLWDTNSKEEIDKIKKMVILEGDKTLNDREAQKDKLFNSENRR